MLSSPTIKDVARIAGVHFTTVSKALRGNPSIPPETRNRIVGVAQRMGYRRNEIFSALSSQRQRNEPEVFTPRIAYLSNRSPEQGFLQHAHHRQFYESARSQAESLGYRFEVLYVDEGHHNSETLSKYLEENAISGLIIGAFEPSRHSLELDWSRYAVVKIDSGHLPLPVTTVANDQLESVRCAFRELRALGYKRIGLAVGAQDEASSDGRHLSGLLLEQQQLPAQERVKPLFFPLATTYAQAVPLLGSWVRAEKPDAVLCNWDGIDRMLATAGIACPNQVACACLCITEAHPTLAGVKANLDLVGRRVAAHLASLLREDQRGIPEQAATTYVTGTWIPGASAPGKKHG